MPFRCEATKQQFQRVTFTSNHLFQVVEQDYIAGLSSTQQSKMASTFSAVEGLAALNTRLSGALVEQNVSDQGLILARIAVWLDPASDAAKRNLARALIAEKNASGAEQIWASIDSKSPYWPRIVSEKFKHLSESGNSQSALNHKANITISAG